MKIGIWGFGVVGQSLLKYLAGQQACELLVYDSKDLSDNALIKACQGRVVGDLQAFLDQCDLIFPSPGVDLAAYQTCQAKFKSELDLFYQNWHKPIIAITGTLGKTTLTTLLATILNQADIKTVGAGNVGLAMCDILESGYEQVVLELSSFQLEQACDFAPDLAIWTNFYPNHLDRHKTLVAYAHAKFQIFLKQNRAQIALIPISLLGELSKLGLNVLDLNSQIYLFGSEHEGTLIDELSNDLKSALAGIFIVRAGKVLLLTDFVRQQGVTIADLDYFKQIDTYAINLVILAAVCYLRQVVLPANLVFEAIAHRVEKFYTSANRIDFYNDSKSTVGQATLAAVNKLAGRPIILFLGGLSKGVNRASLIQDLVGKVKFVICFGAEASQLHAMCQANDINSVQFDILEPALDYCLRIACAGDQVLFSPSGASFDLFNDYVQRGEIFKKLVQQKVAGCLN